MDQKMILQKILLEICEERERQRVLDIGGNTNDFDAKNTQNDWVAYICAYAGAAADKIWDDKSNLRFHNNLIKVGALILAALEANELGHCQPNEEGNGRNKK